jgi:3-polyprenyl-4-hydroxybenzoate decarboxylase
MKTDATNKIPGEGFKRAWPALIKMDAAVKKKIDSFADRNNYSF